MREALERVRPLAAESLVAVFGIVMRERADAALEDQPECHAARGRHAS